MWNEHWFHQGEPEGIGAEQMPDIRANNVMRLCIRRIKPGTHDGCPCGFIGPAGKGTQAPFLDGFIEGNCRLSKIAKCRPFLDVQHTEDTFHWATSDLVTQGNSRIGLEGGEVIRGAATLYGASQRLERHQQVHWFTRLPPKT